MKLGYQLYSSRHFGPLDLTCKMLAGLGYGYVEGYGGLFLKAESQDELRTVLDRYELAMPSAHMGLDMVENSPEAVIDLAREFELTQIFIPYLEVEDRPMDSVGWVELGKRLEHLADPFDKVGIRLGWHNHDFEFAPTPDGAFPIELLLDAAPSLGFEFDLAWAARAGQDPLAWVNRLEDRITAAHVKDIAPKGEAQDEDGWADVGVGVMDWAGLTARLAGAGCRLFVVEHDNPSNDQRFALRSLDYLQTL